MKKTYLQAGSLLVILLNLAACNGGTTSATPVQNIVQSESSHLTADSRPGALRVTSGDDGDIKWKDKLWERPFVLQYPLGAPVNDSLSGFIGTFPHGGSVYSEDRGSENSNKFDLKKDNFSDSLNSGETILTVKPCYEYHPGNEILVPADVATLRVLLTSDNRVFLASPTTEDTLEWKLLGRTHAQNDSTTTKLNDIACYAEPDENSPSGDNVKQIVVSVVGQKTDAENGTDAYAEMGFAVSNGDAGDASWKALAGFSEKGKSTGLNAVTVGNATDVAGSIEPVFAAAGDNGVIMRVDASTQGTARYEMNEENPEENTNLNYNAIGYIPSTRRFLIGGDFYLTVVNMSGAIHVKNNVKLKDTLPGSLDKIPNLKYSEQVGHVGVTSIACTFEYCVVAIKSFTEDYKGSDDKNQVQSATELFHITQADDLPNPQKIKTYDSIKIGDSFFPGELNPQLYADGLTEGNGRIFLLTSTASDVSKIYQLAPDSETDFKGFVDHMPSQSRNH